MTTFYRRYKRKIILSLTCGPLLGGLGGLGLAAILNVSLLIGAIIGAASLLVLAFLAISLTYCCLKKIKRLRFRSRREDDEEDTSEIPSATSQQEMFSSFVNPNANNDPNQYLLSQMETILSDLWGNRPISGDLKSEAITTIYNTLQNLLPRISQTRTSIKETHEQKIERATTEAQKIRDAVFLPWLKNVCRAFGMSMHTVTHDDWVMHFEKAMWRYQNDPSQKPIIEFVEIDSRDVPTIIVFYYDSFESDPKSLAAIFNRYPEKKATPIDPIPGPPNSDPNFSSLAPTPHVPASLILPSSSTHPADGSKLNFETNLISQDLSTDKDHGPSRENAMHI